MRGPGKFVFEVLGFAVRLVVAAEPSQRLDTDHLSFLLQNPIGVLSSVTANQ